MPGYQEAFIKFAIHNNVLRFGEFKLKSGRTSPYFFNAGLFNTSATLAELGRFYAQALQSNNIKHDMLFGPAYKGIPLVSTTAVALAMDHDIDIPFAFNRKEAKDHGEGGLIVGAPLLGRVLIVDDVITAGTAIREVIQLIKNAGAEPAGVLIALDRQERGQKAKSAIQEIEDTFSIPVNSIINLEQILGYIEESMSMNSHYNAVAEYRNAYGV